jgi:2,5-diamino-6-(ribosylamino)-4(3H)-pyrimidinone 5'-phosphate reductase
VSLNGCTTGFEVDLSRFYSLLPTWREGITLTGADTILAQEPELAAAPRPGPTRGTPLLVVVDSRKRGSCMGGTKGLRVLVRRPATPGCIESAR